jgi:hypothetical protein
MQVRSLLGENVTAATNTLSAIEFLGSSFFLRSVSYQMKVSDELVQTNISSLIFQTDVITNKQTQWP